MRYSPYTVDAADLDIPKVEKLASGSRRVRKPRPCPLCRKPMERGDLLWYWTGKVDGEFTHDEHCDRCGEPY